MVFVVSGALIVEGGASIASQLHVGGRMVVQAEDQQEDEGSDPDEYALDVAHGSLYVAKDIQVGGRVMVRMILQPMPLLIKACLHNLRIVSHPCLLPFQCRCHNACEEIEKWTDYSVSRTLRLSWFSLVWSDLVWNCRM